MKKGDVIHTPEGAAKVLGFPMMKGFHIGVRMRIKATKEEKVFPKFQVLKWQEEKTYEPA